MRLYLDNSFLNRPFDDQNIGMHKLETDIFLFIDLVRKKEIILLNSSMIEYENSLNPFRERKIFVEKIIKLAKICLNIDEKILLRAIEITQKMKIDPIDALHISVAESANVVFFITCDYNVIKKYKGSLQVINPLQFINYYANSN